MKLLRTAYRTRSLTECRSSFRMILARWVSTVLVLIASAAAISLLSLPAATREKTSRSREERSLAYSSILDRMRSGQVQQHGGALKRARHHACGSKICKTGGVRASLLACLLHNRGALESNR